MEHLGFGKPCSLWAARAGWEVTAWEWVQEPDESSTSAQLSAMGCRGRGHRGFSETQGSPPRLATGQAASAAGNQVPF